MFLQMVPSCFSRCLVDISVGIDQMLPMHLLRALGLRLGLAAVNSEYGVQARPRLSPTHPDVCTCAQDALDKWLRRLAVLDPVQPCTVKTNTALIFGPRMRGW